MKLSKRNTLLFIVTGIVAVLLIIELNTAFLGQLIMMIAPCTEDLTSSAPCTALYDGVFVVLLVVATAILGLTAIVSTVMTATARRTKR